jgi:hypothetical protein
MTRVWHTAGHGRGGVAGRQLRPAAAHRGQCKESGGGHAGGWPGRAAAGLTCRVLLEQDVVKEADGAILRKTRDKTGERWQPARFCRLANRKGRGQAGCCQQCARQPRSPALTARETAPAPLSAVLVTNWQLLNSTWRK